MALVLADRIQETTTTTGTGTVTLLGAVQGFQSFSAVGNANTTYYTIAGQGTSEWEVGLGTYTSSGTTLSRTTVLGSSNSGSLVNFSAGTKNVFVTYPASQATLLDATQTLTNKTLTSPTIGGTPVMNASVITSGTAVASTSGTSIDFTSIPSWVKRVTVMFQGISTNGISTLLLQLGSGSVTTSGYLGASSAILDTVTGAANYTTGFGVGKENAAARVQHGALTLSLLESSTNTWVCSGVVGSSNEARAAHTGGSIALAGAIDRVRITTVGGANTFDAGKVNILYE
jgi:hypothetical protein